MSVMTNHESQATDEEVLAAWGAPSFQDQIACRSDVRAEGGSWVAVVEWAEDLNIVEQNTQTFHGPFPSIAEAEAWLDALGEAGPEEAINDWYVWFVNAPVLP